MVSHLPRLNVTDVNIARAGGVGQGKIYGVNIGAAEKNENPDNLTLRHCERSEAIQSGFTPPWVASLRSQ
jgi:hypothetical protein